MTFGTVLGGLAGGLIGTLVWILVGYFTGYEVGYIAWGVGLLAGLGLRFFASKAEIGPSFAQGITAGVIAIACILAGKFGVASLFVANDRRAVAEFLEQTPVTDDMLVAVHAREIAEEWEKDGRDLQWPAGQSIITAEAKNDFPSDVWAEAQREWKSLPEEERKQQTQRYDAGRKEYYNAGVADEVAVFKDSFAAWDLLWAFLAVGTAYKIGASSRSNE